MFTENDNYREKLLNKFASELPGVRKKLKMSQSELGEKVGLSRQSISSVERGIVPLTWNVFLAIVLVVLINEPEVLNDISSEQDFFEIVESLKKSSSS